MLAKGQAEPAFTELRSIAQSASDSLPDLSLISALLRRQKLDEALQAIDVLERKQPDKPIAANLRGRVQLARRDLTAAIPALNKHWPRTQNSCLRYQAWRRSIWLKANRR